MRVLTEWKVLRIGTRVARESIRWILFFALGSVGDASERPNVLLVMTDDQGYWDTGATGNPHIDTPHMDSLAKQGAWLRRYYASPVCAPTRAGMMTGRYYLRTGLYNTRFGGDSLGLNEVTLAELMQQRGYRTGLFGKWHLGKYPNYQPQRRGFDEFFGHYHGHIERYQFPDQVFHNGKLVEARGYVSDVFTNAAIDFVESSAVAEQPFFCALMFNAPHSPFLLDTSHYGQPTGDAFLTKYLERGLPIREARIYALIERVDENLGRLLATLDRLHLSENTMVVFTSDNGGVSKFFKAGMHGNKASVYEGGVRAPCFVRWPEKITAGRVIDGLTCHVDWLPTCCELAGAEPPDDRIIDGKSLVSLLTTTKVNEHQPFVYHTWDRYHPNPNQRWAISDARWKLLCQVGAGVTASRRHWKLYDLENDPSESNNLAAHYPDHVDRLREEFLRWFADATKGQDYRPVAIPIGSQPVKIEPSWGTWEGPNTEYVFDGYDWDTIQGWREKGESVRFRIEVSRAGAYRVELVYGCRPLDAGGLLRIEVGEQRLQHSIEATATADQFERFEVGTLNLASQHEELTFAVEHCPEQELMRLNQIWLIPEP